MIAKNNRKIADLAFTQQAITTVTNTITAYYELAYARANVKVQQQAVTVAEKLYNDNKKQLEIGTMAPLDVTRAESELATDRQNLIVAQTAQLQHQQILRNAVSKDPMAPNLVNVEIITTDNADAARGRRSRFLRGSGQRGFREAARSVRAGDQPDQCWYRRQGQQEGLAANGDAATLDTAHRDSPVILLSSRPRRLREARSSVQWPPVTVLDAVGILCDL